jgi:LacI family transcriptional regulator
MATNADIAKAAGVSPAIVSRIVNSDPSLRVSEDTRARVLRLIEELDYSPNLAARNLKSSSTGVIALVVHELTSSVYSEIIAGAHEAAYRFGKTVLVGEANEATSERGHLEDLVAGKGVDGIILQGAGTKFDKALERAARQGVPTVLLQAGDPAKNTVVRLDDEAAGQTATKHLIGLGHTNIGFIGVAEDMLFSSGRQAGWADTMRAHGLPMLDRWSVCGGNKFDRGSAAVEQLLQQAPEITGIVVANVVSSIGVMAKLHDLKYSVPQDISLVAIHDIPLAEYLRPALTVVRMPLRDLGSLALQQVVDQSTQKGTVLANATEPRLIARSTTSHPR